MASLQQSLQCTIIIKSVPFAILENVMFQLNLMIGCRETGTEFIPVLRHLSSSNQSEQKLKP